MLYDVKDFDKKTPSDIPIETISLQCDKYINVYTIKSVHDLTQFIGFGKYINNKEHNDFLRGQTSLYNGSLIPSLYRGRSRLNTITAKYNNRMKCIEKRSKILYSI